VSSTPGDVLDGLVRQLHETSEPDEERCGDIGVGPLENLLRHHELELWDEVERLARSDARFLRALAYVWAYSSPAFARRDALLTDLGEQWPESLEFVAIRRGFGSNERTDTRAIRHSGVLSEQAFAEVLRGIAESLERSANHTRVAPLPPEPVGPHRLLEGVVRAFLTPDGVATWSTREHGDLGMGLVVAGRRRRLLWLPCSRNPDGEWEQWTTTSRPGWVGPDGHDRGIHVQLLDNVAPNVEAVQVDVVGRGNVDIPPVDGHVVLIHWDVPRDFEPQGHHVVALRQAGVWEPATTS
jgi:hypothetical protein